MMSHDDFWNLIETVHEAAPADMDAKCEELTRQLKKYTPEDVAEFDRLFREHMVEAYHWDLWGAAYIIGGGCSDDGFMDFRATLISLGRNTFEQALADPETLAELDIEDADDFFFEGFQYIASQVYEEITGKTLPARTENEEDVAGDEWDEDTVDVLFPALARKFS